MPYVHGYSKAAIAANVKHFRKKKYPPRRAVAAALTIARTALRKHCRDRKSAACRRHARALARKR